jgi:ribose 5-phosphate isomerase B
VFKILQNAQAVINGAVAFDVVDVGTYSKDSCDYPVIAKKLCSEILNNNAQKGVLVCGSGVGMSIVANKHKGIRAVVCSDTYSAKMSKKHNNTNVLCLGERVVGADLAKDILDSWLSAEFEGERHLKRVQMYE